MTDPWPLLPFFQIFPLLFPSSLPSSFGPFSMYYIGNTWSQEPRFDFHLCLSRKSLPWASVSLSTQADVIIINLLISWGED
jgi:hypothetical protein